MRHLISGLLLVSLLAEPTTAQPGPTATPPTLVLAVLVEGSPNAGGKILSVSPLETPASADVQSATYATLRIGTRRFVFAIGRVAPIRSAVGSTLVRLRDGSRSLFEVAAVLSEALAGKRDLVLLTQGTLNTGVVVAIVPLSSGSGSARVAAEEATQATILLSSRETSVTIGPSGGGLPMLALDGSEGGPECRFCEGAGGAP